MECDKYLDSEFEMPKNIFELLEEINKGNIDKLPDIIEVDGDPFEKRTSKKGKVDYYGIGEKKSLTEIFSRYWYIEDWLKLDVREW